MNKLRKKFIALTMAGVMMCAPCTVFATAGDLDLASGNASTLFASGNTASGNVSGDASGIVGAVTKDIVKVVLPTADTTSNTLSTLQFTLDPQLLLSSAVNPDGTETDIAFATDEDKKATVLFATTDDDGKTVYSSKSDDIEIINKGTVPVKVELTPTASVTGGGGLAIASGNAPAADATELYLSMTDGTTTKQIVAAGTAADPFKFDLEAAPDGAYKTTYASGNYTYALDPNYEGTFDTKTFTISGSTSEGSSIDWTKVENDTASISLAWTISKGEVYDGTAPTFTTSLNTITYSGGTGNYAITNSAIKSITTTVSGTEYDLLAGDSTLGIAAANKATEGTIAIDENAGYVINKNSVPVTLVYTITNSNSVSKDVTVTFNLKVK